MEFSNLQNFRLVIRDQSRHFIAGKEISASFNFSSGHQHVSHRYGQLEDQAWTLSVSKVKKACHVVIGFSWLFSDEDVLFIKISVNDLLGEMIHLFNDPYFELLNYVFDHPPLRLIHDIHKLFKMSDRPQLPQRFVRVVTFVFEMLKRFNLLNCVIWYFNLVWTFKLSSSFPKYKPAW